MAGDGDSQRAVFWKWMTESCQPEDPSKVIILDSTVDPEELRDRVLERILG